MNKLRLYKAFGGSMVIIYTVIFMLGSLLTFRANAELTGEARRNFIDSSLQACYNNQRQSSINSNVPDETIYKYCRCVAIYTANALTNQVVAEVEAGKRQLTEIANLSQLTGKYCSHNYKKY